MSNNNNNSTIATTITLENYDPEQVSRMIMYGNSGPLLSMGGIEAFIQLSKQMENDDERFKATNNSTTAAAVETKNGNDKNDEESSSSRRGTNSKISIDEEFFRICGISTTSIGARILKFGSGNLRIREDPRLQRYFSLSDMDKYDETSVLSFSLPVKEETSEDEDDDDFFPGSFIRYLDYLQNSIVYEIVRDGETAKVYGAQLVFGDIIHLADVQREGTITKEEEELEKIVRDLTVEKRSFQVQKDRKERLERVKRRDQSNVNSKDEEIKQIEKDITTTLTILELEEKIEELNKKILREQKKKMRLTKARQTKIPADCLILDGEVYQDSSDMTGESECPRCDRNRHPQLLAGSRIVSGRCTAMVVGVGKNSLLSSLDFIRDGGQDRRSRMERCRQNCSCSCC